MKRLLVIIFAALLFISASDKTPQQQYIEKYALTAVREMYRSGVPASITLAQGLLESRYGESRLASEGNNHFGIKCHRDWDGNTIYADDDEKNECFRAYGSADQSFRDHSDFLRYKDRYKFLFEYDVTDYKAWALGLRQAGYATDPSYGQKLIGIIENYKLYEYDTMENEEEVEEYVEDQVKEQAKDKESKKSRTKTKSVRSKARVDEKPDREDIPSSPLSIEEAVEIDRSGLEQFHFNLNRPTYKRNNVAFVYATEGESYESIANAYSLFLKEILRFNDATADRQLVPGEIVFIQPKKKQAPKGLDKYIVSEDGENLRDICQRFAVRLASIEKINGFAPGRELYEGDTILLR